MVSLVHYLVSGGLLIKNVIKSLKKSDKYVKYVLLAGVMGVLVISLLSSSGSSVAKQYSSLKHTKRAQHYHT